MKTQIKILSLLFIISQITFAESLNWQKANSAGMDYLIYVPRNRSELKLSLMVSLHGCAQHAEDLAQLANWESAAESNNMIVVLPKVPNGGVVLGCWDYYGKDHTEKNRHNGPLISLTESLIADAHLKVDSSKVFISGLSSGSGEAAILGCMRPDLFSGVGLNSGPAAGTEKSELNLPNSTNEDVAKFCKGLAGPREKYFEHQITSVILGNQDFIVNPKHSDLTIGAMQLIYKTASSKELDLATLSGANKQGHGMLYLNQQKQTRISFIVNNGLGHAWASGKGTGSTDHYVNPNSINYPAYLADLFGNRNP
jgi:poly(3-hydroxybutyrate) depolymerase